MKEYKNPKTGHIYLKIMQKSHFIYCVYNKLETIPFGYDIHHKDGNVENNTIENLEMIERSKHGLLHSKNPELKNVNWEEIYNEWKSESFLTKTEIAKKLKCCRKTINRHFNKIMRHK